MKRFHVNMTVADLDRSVAFYSRLFAAEPSVQRPDYAKWMLEDPRINFAITTRGKAPGIDHVGFQVEDGEELAEVRTRLEAADAPILDQADTVCCYARSKKAWIDDPDGLSWETFLSLGAETYYGTDDLDMDAGACCARPEAATAIEAEPAANADAGCCAPSSSCC